MTKQRGTPDRRGMGAQSDFIAEQFVPGEEYKAKQMAMVETLLASGVSPEQIAKMFAVPLALLSPEKPDLLSPGKPALLSPERPKDL
jgi:hypothetical protein